MFDALAKGFKAAKNRLAGLTELTEQNVKEGRVALRYDEEAMKQHLLEPGYFEPTPEWDKERSSDWLYS